LLFREKAVQDPVLMHDGIDKALLERLLVEGSKV
jgi:hypothetical protein